MTAHEYLVGLLNAQNLRTEDIESLRKNRAYIESVLRSTYGSTPRFYYGGSYGKRTLIQAAFDLDIVMYFPSTDTRTLKDIYYGANRVLTEAGLIVQAKNVALRLPYTAGYHIDVVPGRAQDSSFEYATLYKSEENSTRQTSIKVHIDSVRNSGAREIIRLIKLWRNRRALSWSSFALEQIVIRALSGKSTSDYATSMMTVFSYIESNIANMRLIDPANSNNEIEMSWLLRQQLQTQAYISRNAQNWGMIVW